MSESAVVHLKEIFAPIRAEELNAARAEALAIEQDDGSTPILPPADAEPGETAAARLFNRKPDAIWRYATADDATAFHVARWNKADGGKIVMPVSWIDGDGWKLKAWPKDRPLYNLANIVAKPDAPIVICEGEAAADAAGRIFPNSIAATSSGGSNAANKTDWTPLAGRRVLIWPDCDEPGGKYANAAATVLHGLDCAVSIVDAVALAAIAPDGGQRAPIDRWDAKDAIEEGRPLADLRRDAFAFAKPFDPGPVYLSHGPYDMSAKGLTTEIETGRGENKTRETVWIAAPFEILGACRDPNGRGWGKWIRWRDADGRAHVQHVADGALQGEPAALCAGLASDGLKINRAHQRHLVAYLSAANVRGRVTIVSRTGWHEIGGHSVFVLAEETFGPRGAERVILDAAAIGPYESRGTLRDWQAGVGALAGGHSMPMLAVSAAFAGPLLHMAGQAGGGVNFLGRSSIGKTTLAQSAASVWGRGNTPGYVRTWRATANGLEGVAAGATDTALILDELSQAEPREVSAALYSLANGVGKARAARDGGLREPKSWRVLVLSTGEMTIEEKLAEDRGRKTRAGQLVRMLDIRCERASGVFDNAGPDGVSANLVKAFKTAAESAYGTAGPEFVRRLIQEGVSGDDVRTLVNDFVGRHVPERSDGQVDRAAQRLGLVAVAGELATTFGLTPWTPGEPTRVAGEALAGWIAERGGTEAAEVRQAIEQVRLLIEAHGESRFQPVDDPDARPVANRLGWRKGSGSDREWWCPPQTWKTEICNGRDPQFVARVLAERDMLRRQGGDTLQSVVRINGSTVRAYVLTANIIDGGGHAE